ncbi:MAG: crotonase/enoyl-CoA hydratase family protein [Nevskia sp.]
MSQAFARYEQQDRVVTITLDRAAERNAIGELAHCDELVAALERVQADARVSCLILTGAGSAFSAGGNLRAMQQRRGIGGLDSPAATRGNYRRGVQKVIQALWNLEVPAIAAVNGHALGLGCDLACLCDIRIAAESAQFASSFINIGLVPGDGGAWILPRAVGLSKAAEMIFTGDTMDAKAALACGLVSRVVPDAALLAEAGALAAKIAAKPAQTLRLSKRLLREGQHSRLSDILELSAAYQALAHETEDHGEALDAFFDKRPPSFQGR